MKQAQYVVIINYIINSYSVIKTNMMQVCSKFWCLRSTRLVKYMLLKVCVKMRDPGIRKKYSITVSIHHIDILRDFLIA
jgi:hypothetical protein